MEPPVKTSGILRLRRFKSLTSGTADKIHKLAEILKNAMADNDHGDYYKNKFDQALTNPDHYRDGQRDLYHFADWLSYSSNIPDRSDDFADTIKSRAAQVKNYLTDSSFNKCIIAEGHADGFTESNGISIYLPESAEQGETSDWELNKLSYNKLDWAIDTLWDDILETRY